MAEELKFINQNLAEGIESLFKFRKESKKFIAIHMLGDYEMKVYFTMYPNNLLVGMNSFMQRIYVGKIGERQGDYAELCLFYLDNREFPKVYGDFSEVEFKRVVSYRDRLYFRENGYPIFFDSFGKDKFFGIRLPESNGSLYQEMKEYNDGSQVSVSLIPYLYCAIAESFKNDPSFYITLKTIEKCCDDSPRGYSAKELAAIYDELNTSMGVQPYPSSFTR